MKKVKWQNVWLVGIFILLYAPIFYLIFYSFSSGDNMNGFRSFTWANYQALFVDKRMIEIVLQTLLIAILSSLCATIVGTFGALGIYETKHRRVRNMVLALNNILMVSPDVIIGASFLIFFTFLGLGLGFGSVLLSHIAFSIPIVVLMILPKLNEMRPALVDAARDLGATDWQVLSKVILPYISSGIFAGFFMAFTYSLDDFAVTFFVTGNGFETLSVEIYSRARQGISLEINALSALMFVFSLILVAGYYLLNQRNQAQKARRKRKAGA
ncbi:ABC transporter permease [Latilactobacillus graminis]|uniref:Binding--dependent transport system inner membrane component family protein n=2 Tax=Latilactobacillus graminis TaxID=60519 RepID=A0AA89KWK1_9LACO|nr:ABC transporter permease [Latilactobacillus graminis]KRM21148.1 binding--dependent transport system inner membrane component family protein [Latilactobacillus graminis DSM 20719]QFP79274.1 ABC transporter permease [Latilactobacillus graminis]